MFFCSGIAVKLRRDAIDVLRRLVDSSKLTVVLLFTKCRSINKPHPWDTRLERDQHVISNFTGAVYVTFVVAYIDTPFKQIAIHLGPGSSTKEQMGRSLHQPLWVLQLSPQELPLSP